MAEMLAVLGCDTLEQLIDQTIPADLRQGDALDWEPLSEGSCWRNCAQ
jgi:glycine dehydrogenase